MATAAILSFQQRWISYVTSGMCKLDTSHLHITQSSTLSKPKRATQLTNTELGKGTTYFDWSIGYIDFDLFEK
jgi:hypothetical protein